MTISTPLLDTFKRGEAARDVRLLAAAGGIAPRAPEQMALLMFLLDDPDREVQQTAEGTAVTWRDLRFERRGHESFVTRVVVGPDGRIRSQVFHF